MTTTIALQPVEVEIQGLPPGMLMASKRIMDANLAEGGTGKKKKVRRPEEEAELHAYWTMEDRKKVLGLPWNNLYRCICDGAGQFKYKGQKTMSTIIAATITCETEVISLGTKDYEVYQEWCRIPPRTGSVVKVARPRVKKWSAQFTVLVDDELYEASILEEIINHAGRNIGVGPWRPALKGPYGKFFVSKFEVAK